MPLVTPSPPRHRIEEEAGALRVIIPSRKYPLSFVFLAVWLMIWAFGMVMVSSFLFRSRGTAAPDLFLLFWLALWSAGGASAALSLLWQIAGREILEVKGDSISIRREILRIGRTDEYLREHVRDFRAQAPPISIGPWMRTTSMWGMGQASLAFDYGARTIRLGLGLDDAEAKIIVDAVLRRFPRFAPATHSC